MHRGDAGVVGLLGIGITTDRLLPVLALDTSLLESLALGAIGAIAAMSLL
jgi:hypothetical protein